MPHKLFFTVSFLLLLTLLLPSSVTTAETGPDATAEGNYRYELGFICKNCDFRIGDRIYIPATQPIPNTPTPYVFMAPAS